MRTTRFPAALPVRRVSRGERILFWTYVDPGAQELLAAVVAGPRRHPPAGVWPGGDVP
jgi:hypothetical protein